jgi:hypothetical protein
MSTPNPYAISIVTDDDEDGGPPPEKWHPLAWQMPFIGLGITIVLNITSVFMDAAAQDPQRAASSVGLAGGVIFVGSILLGWLFCVGVLVSLILGKGGLSHLIGGVIMNALFTAFIVYSFFAVYSLREAHRQQPISEPVELSVEGGWNP